MSYGSELQANTPDQAPDLILAIATNGKEGYVRRVALYPQLFPGPPTTRSGSNHRTTRGNPGRSRCTPRTGRRSSATSTSLLVPERHPRPNDSPRQATFAPPSSASARPCGAVQTQKGRSDSVAVRRKRLVATDHVTGGGPERSRPMRDHRHPAPRARAPYALPCGGTRDAPLDRGDPFRRVLGASRPGLYCRRRRRGPRIKASQLPEASSSWEAIVARSTSP